MQRLAVIALGICATVIAGCAPAVAPAPVVTTPRYPDFIRPPVPAAAATSAAGVLHDRAWRFLQAGDLQGAEREIALALTASPGFHPAETASGYVALAQSDPGTALGRFDRALAVDGRYVSALAGRGQALMVMDRDDEAALAFEAALAADPTLVDLQRRVAVLRFRILERDLAAARQASSAGRLSEAARAYREAIASSPDSAFLYRELGLVERALGTVDEALADFRRAAELDAFDAVSVAQIASILEARGELDEALRFYEQSLAIDRVPAVEAARNSLVARMELAGLPEEFRAIEAAPQVTRADLSALIGVRLDAPLRAAPRGVPVVITDVRGSWAERWIMAVASAGVIEPYDNHTFQPLSVVRRIDLAQAVSRLLPLVARPGQVQPWREARLTFSDLATGHLAYPAASAAVASGVMRTDQDRRFDPVRIVTGAEALAVVQRLVALRSGAAVERQ